MQGGPVPGTIVKTSKDIPKRFDSALAGEYQPAIPSVLPWEQLARCEEGSHEGQVLRVEVVVEDRLEDGTVPLVGEEGGVFVFGGGFGFEEEDCRLVLVLRKGGGHGSCWV